MLNVNDIIVDTVMDEMESNVNVFHMRMKMRVMGTGHCSLIVTLDDGQ